MRLLVTYGLIKNQKSEKVAGEKVFKSILSVSHKLDDTEKENLPLLWQAWAWESLRCKDYGKAMRCVLQICNSEPTKCNDMEKAATQPQIDDGEQVSQYIPFFIFQSD